MTQETAATFENGVLIPDQPLNLPPHSRVRLTVNPIDDAAADRENTWDELERLWQTSTFNSEGDRLTREQLHERH